jgi:hypothetical protein
MRWDQEAEMLLRRAALGALAASAITARPVAAGGEQATESYATPVTIAYAVPLSVMAGGALFWIATDEPAGLFFVHGGWPLRRHARRVRLSRSSTGSERCPMRRHRLLARRGSISIRLGRHRHRQPGREAPQDLCYQLVPGGHQQRGPRAPLRPRPRRHVLTTPPGPAPPARPNRRPAPRRSVSSAEALRGSALRAR